MEKEKISVIVSAYNAEEYLKDCLDSILSQTYKNLEILLVDDGSKDHTLKIMKEYEQKEKRVRVLINTFNKGAAFSRNLALKHAKGEYIGIVDADDTIPATYYESLLQTLKQKKSDVVVCDIILVQEKTKEKIRTICGNQEQEKTAFLDNGFAASPCNKLYKKEVLVKYPFPEGKINEDVASILPLLVLEKVSYNAEVCYSYYQHSSSVQNGRVSDKKFDIFDTTHLALERLQKCDDFKEIREIILYQQLVNFFLYTLTQEPHLLKRAKWFRRFQKESRPYRLQELKRFQMFLSSRGRKHKMYYQTLFFLNEHSCSFLSSFLVSCHNFLSKRIFKNPLPQNITLKDLVRLAQKQSHMKNEKVTISVVVPNYNYEEFLYQRLYSILSQKVKLYEILLLDDCSKDKSREKIEALEKALAPYLSVRKVYNTKNSGSAFKQWQKGFLLAQGDYVWIAEADDFCEPTFLKNLLRPILKEKGISISYCDTAMIQADGKIISKSIVPEIDLQKSGHWKRNYVALGTTEFQKYSYLNCTIANVSSTLIKRGDYHDFFKDSCQYKQAGDWLFYVNVMQLGKIAYCRKALNYYRLHGNNVTSVTKKEEHFKEIQSVHAYFDEKYHLNATQKEQIQKRYAFLEEVWHFKIKKIKER